MPSEKVAAFRNSPETAGFFLDFDGTLSEIVHRPHEARPAEGVGELLTALSQRLKLVAIVSGRSAHQLVEWLGPDVEIWGTHGAERAVGGTVELSNHAAAFRDLMAEVKQEAEKELAALALPGVVLEDKTVMLGFHFRAANDVPVAEQALRGLANGLAERHGLTIAGGRLAFELRAPMEFSKAAVVLERAREADLATVGFAGDDRVDLPGFDALDILEEEGSVALRVAVDSPEAPPELLERADLVVPGPTGAVRFLQGLLGS